MCSSDLTFLCDPHHCGLAQAFLSGLENSFVGESARSRDNPDFTLAVDVPWHDSDFALPRLNYSRAVGTDEARFAALCHCFLHPHLQSIDSV